LIHLLQNKIQKKCLIGAPYSTAAWAGEETALRAGGAASRNPQHCALLCRRGGWKIERRAVSVGECEGWSSEGPPGPKVQWPISGGNVRREGHVAANWRQTGVGGA